jgi:hypothetical protein
MKSSDITDIAQLMAPFLVINNVFHVYEDFANLCNLKGTTTGEDFFLNIEEMLFF